MTSVEIQFATDVFAVLRKSPDEVAREMRLAAALLWYARGLVSQGKAAEIAGLSRSAFIDALAESEISANQETLEDLDEALARARRDEPRESLAEVRASLRAQGKLPSVD